MSASPIDLASLGAAVIAAGGSWLARRSAGKATVDSSTITSRLDMEKEAYERARAMDTETIERQDRELKALRQSDAEKDRRLRAQEIEIAQLKAQVRALARRFGSEGLIDGARVEPGDQVFPEE